MLFICSMFSIGWVVRCGFMLLVIVSVFGLICVRFIVLI